MGSSWCFFFAFLLQFYVFFCFFRGFSIVRNFGFETGVLLKSLPLPFIQSSKVGLVWKRVYYGIQSTFSFSLVVGILFFSVEHGLPKEVLQDFQEVSCVSYTLF